MANYVSFQTVLSFNIPDDTIKSGIRNYRQGKSHSWANIKDPKDGRKILIDLDTIPDRTRKKYDIPTAEEYTTQQQLENYQGRQNKEQSEALFIEETEKEVLIDAFKNQWMPYYEIYKVYFSFYPEKKCKKVAINTAQNHAFWLAMLEITGTRYKAYRGKIAVGLRYYEELKKQLKFNSTITSYCKFSARLKTLREALLKEDKKAFEKEVLYGKRQPKLSQRKTTDFHKMVAFEVLTHEKQYSYRVVTDLVNHHCQLEGLPTITESWVKQLMNGNYRDSQTFRNLVDSYRKGKKGFNDTLQSYMVRKNPPYPANVWMIDGTPMQFYCYSEDGKRLIRLNLFVVIDVCTRKIVGFDVSRNEDRYNILDSLQLAVEMEGHLPAEIISDNFSANKTEEIKDLQEEMQKLGVIWRFARVGNPQDKSQVERFFGVFQSLQCALYDDYLGEGIQSKRDNRPSKEFLQEHAKKQGYITHSEMAQRIAIMIGVYNETQRENIGIPLEKYKKLPKPHAKELDPVRIAFLFWNKTKHTIKRSMVRIKIKGVTYHFDLPTNELKLELNNQTVGVRYDKNALDRVMLFHIETDDFICECKQSLSAHIGHVDRTQEDELNTVKQSAVKKSFSSHIEKTRESIREKGLQQVGKQELKITNPLSLEKNQINTLESLQTLKYFLNTKEIPFEPPKDKEFKPIQTIRSSKQKGYKELTTQTPTKKGTNKPVGTIHLTKNNDSNTQASI